ncbi:MAG TPA: UDP-N-acetylmuramoyl-L-alanine--D-glutamate ligase [Candidatus Dormibacteraeota bacterium]|nr:UDP-N-acetylmuramoyl-L-alanine--D-glutamate ligase [Candidatus Dormibacteraeota bacterium]
MKTLEKFPFSHVLVLGLARSGTAAAKLLLESEIKVRVNDYSTNENDQIVTELKEMGAEVIVGSHPLSVLDHIELIVKNPGIPYDNIVIEEAQKRNIPIITEIELAGQLVSGQVIGITGSNGKTTTTTLVTQMLAQSNQPVKVAGNIGTVATEVVQEMREDEKLVLELSSFQLLGVQTFKPNIAVLLNVYEAHLDYHKTIENYQQAKFNLFMNQSEEDYLIYNADDHTLAEAIKRAKATLIPFSTTQKLPNGAWFDESALYFNKEKIINRDEIVLVGEHNLENILAAISVAKLSGATNEGIRDVLTTFTGVKHRLQFVKKIQDRLFYNDSKATNILATQKALSAFNQPIILLAGGLDRGNEFTDLIPYLNHVKAMIVFGQTAEKLAQLGKNAGIEQVVTVDDIEAAVQKSAIISAAHDVILLSPACASWDQYRTFEERGDMFINAVHKLA